jgi:uncharacterized protein YecE (DUF72 family)
VPLTAVSSPIRVGTCSWTDATLVKETDWYPKRSMSAAERLRFYAEHFSLAEADSPYYAPPSPETCRGWAERTPPGFIMNVKAYSLLTGHPTKPASLWKDLHAEIDPKFAGKRTLYAQHLSADAIDEVWVRFLASLSPLRESGKLGAVLFQYPRWFTPKRTNRGALEELRTRLGDWPACVELRAPAWTQPDDLDRTVGVLREHHLALVVVDAPPVSGLPTVAEVTTEALAVVRFHGRANDTWDARTGSAAERFRYLYSQDELERWVPTLRELAGQAASVHALMNNCYRDYGVRNAADLQAMLDVDD